MMVEVRGIDYGTQLIEYRLERRERATLEITVEPDGLVRVVAPADAAVEDIAARVHRRARWILAQQRTFADCDRVCPNAGTSRVKRIFTWAGNIGYG